MPASLDPSLDEDNRSAWDTLYASTADLIWGSKPVAFLPRYLPVARSLPPGDVLDAAGGEGRNLSLLLRLDRPVTLCDSSPAALAKIPPGLARRATIVECGLAAIPLPTARFAFILVSDAVETLPTPGPALAELRRLLVPGGLLLANVPDRDDGIAGQDMEPLDGAGWLYRHRYFYRFYSRAEAEAMLIGAGLEIVSSGDCCWCEPAHPHFRNSAHLHRSRIFLARRPG
jgi:SAM-dependent methyltransferase